jgi:aspartate-semialdehyde dehydrogenase
MLNVAVVGATGNTGSGIINSLLEDPNTFVRLDASQTLLYVLRSS